jgi:hypothetical protein
MSSVWGLPPNHAFPDCPHQAVLSSNKSHIEKITMFNFEPQIGSYNIWLIFWKATLIVACTIILESQINDFNRFMNNLYE